MRFKFFLPLACLINIFIFYSIFPFVKAKAEIEEDLGPLDGQAYDILTDFRDSVSNLPKGTTIMSTNIDLVLQDIDDHIVFIETNLKNNNTEAAAYSLDFLINVITEVSSKIPNDTKLNLSNIDFENIEEEKQEILKDILADLSSKKINLIKDSMNYAINLQRLNFNAIATINNVNNLELGFDQLNTELTGIDLDLSALIDVEQFETALKALDELDLEDITKEIEKSLKDTSDLIEEVIAEVAEAIAQTTSQVMDEINSTLGTNMNVEAYAWFWGLEGVDSSTTFSDAVEVFNEAWGWDMTEEEAKDLMTYDVCWLYGMCE